MDTKREIYFLGTGTSTGVPVLGCSCIVCQSVSEKDKRLRSSVLINLQGYYLLVDTSPDLRTQLLRMQHTQIDAIFLTHSHKDHLSGLDDLRAIHFFQKKIIPLYTSRDTMKAIQRDFYYAFDESLYSSVFGVQVYLIDHARPFVLNEEVITPLLLRHAEMEVLGLRVGGLTYITDTNAIAKGERAKILGSHTMIVGALGTQKHHAHFSLQEAIDLAHELRIPHTYITHIGHQMGLYEKVSLPEGISLAYDGLSLAF